MHAVTNSYYPCHLLQNTLTVRLIVVVVKFCCAVADSNGEGGSDGRTSGAVSNLTDSSGQGGSGGGVKDALSDLTGGRGSGGGGIKQAVSNLTGGETGGAKEAGL